MQAIRIAEGFLPARRINHSLTASAEKRALEWMARHAPGWLSSDQLTVLGLIAQVAAGGCYALNRVDHHFLLAGIVFLALNWLGDSLDGTLARVRQCQRPRYGFYVDHIADLFGSIALMGGLAASGLLHAPVAIGLLICFLLLSGESFLAAYTLQSFQLSQGIFGPTELRILLTMGNLAAFHSPWSTVFGHRALLFDLGGSIGVAGMTLMAIGASLRHTAQLYRQEPLRQGTREQGTRDQGLGIRG